VARAQGVEWITRIDFDVFVTIDAALTRAAMHWPRSSCGPGSPRTSRSGP